MKTAFVIGGSRGIGRAIVELFAAEGYLVAFTYKKSEKEAINLASSTGSLAIKADSESEAEIVAALFKLYRELTQK